MTGNAFLLTFQLRLKTCTDLLVKRATSEITNLVESAFSRLHGEIIAKEGEHRRLCEKLQILQKQLEQLGADQRLLVGDVEWSKKSTGTEDEGDYVLDFQMHLNTCMESIITDFATEIIAWVKDNVAKKDELQNTNKRLSDDRFCLKPDSHDLTKTVAHSFEKMHSAGKDIEVTQDKAALEIRQVPDAACFVVAEPSLGYELTVATTAFEDQPHDMQQEEKGDTVLSGSNPEQHSYIDTWETKDMEGSSPGPKSSTPADSVHLQQDLELDSGQGQAEAANHSCSQCGRSFRKQWILHRHMRRHSEGGPGEGGAPGHVCPHCGRSFKHRKGLQSHLHSHSGEKPYPCNVCGQSFTRPESVNKHQRLHSGVKPYACPQCARRFFRSDGLRSHMRTHTEDGRRRTAALPKLCMCAYCGKAFANVTQVANHERTHTGERPYECSQCHKRFRHAGALSVHRITHQRERPHACPQCAKAFRCAKHLKRHLVTHSDARPFSCDLCPLTFRTAAELKGHKVRHGLQRTHACPDCGKSFKTEYEVKLHRRAHSGERPYACQDCGRTFRRLHHLTSHRLTHSGERPHACDLCQRRFLRAREMRSHRRKVHLAVEPSRCDLCQVSFQNLPLLEAHRRSYHGQPDRQEQELPGLSKFPRILPRQVSVETVQGTANNQGVQTGKVVLASQEGGNILSPVVFVLAGQGVSLPVLQPSPVLAPVTTMVTLPQTPVTVPLKVQIPAVPKTPAGKIPAKAALKARSKARAVSVKLPETGTVDPAKTGARRFAGSPVKSPTSTLASSTGAKASRRALVEQHT